MWTQLETTRYVLSPAAVVRLAGIPVTALDGLRCADSWRTATQLIRLRADLAGTTDTLSDLLHAAVGAAGNGELKVRLVAVRRAVHRGRHLDPARLAELPAELRGPVQAWAEQLAEHQRLVAQLPEQLDRDWTASCTALRDAARAPEFQLGLVHANPDMFTAVLKWLSTGRVPQRQNVLKIAQYLARCAAKTSPYSTFTSSGLAAWGQAGELVELSGPSAAAVTGTEVSVGSLHRIARAVSERPEFAEGSRVRINPSATVDGDTLVFLGRRPAEHVHTLALSPTLRRVMELITAESTLHELRGALVARAADGRQADMFLRRLVSIGLLELAPPIADQSPDPIADLRGWLHESRRPGTEGLDRTLTAVHEALSSYPTILTPEERIAVRDAVVRGLDAALREVGDRTHAENPKLATEFARYSFYENAVRPGTAAVLDRDGWRPLLDDLDAVRTLLGLIGPDLPFKLSLGALLRERYPAGAQVPLLTFYRDVLAEQSAGGGFRLAHSRFADPDSSVEQVRELYRLRTASKQLLGGREADADGVVRVSSEEVRALAEHWPAWVRTPTSVAAYCQLIEAEHGPELVVNTIGCGFGRGRNRTRQILDALDLRADAPAEPGPAVGREDVLFAEFEAVARSAVNVRKPGVRLAVDYPGVRSVRGSEDLVPINDLYVRCDEDGLPALVSWRRGRRIRPVHSGLGADRLLPPAARFLIEAFGESNTWFGAHTELRMTADPRAGGSVLRMPRLMVGGVVLRRAMWLARADRIPRRSAAATDADWMLRVAGWLSEHEIPERCFATLLDPGALGREGGRGPSNHTKPNYVDFASPMLLLGLERRLVAPDAIVQITEMLPEPGRIRGERVAEYIVELNEPGVTYA